MKVVIFSGGEDPPRAAADLIDIDALVIAADSGLDHAHRLGVRVQHVVGDMDSVDPVLLDSLAPSTTVDRHPVAKDATDLELAVDVALELDAHEITIIGGHGGRNDHLLANALLLASHRLDHVSIRWVAGSDLIHVVHDRVRIEGSIGSTVSLVPARDVEGVTTIGLEWTLTNESLPSGTTRGVSNQMAKETAAVSITSGTLFVVQEGIVG